jgi:hypothetical protein
VTSGVCLDRDGLALAVAMKHKSNRAIEANLPRRPPDKICEVTEIPRALLRRSAGASRSTRPIGTQVINEDTTANPSRLDWWVAFAEEFRHS